MSDKPVSGQQESGVMLFLRSLRTVAWAFIGLRGRSGHQQDIQKVKPVHVIVVGVLGALALVLALLWIVNKVLGA
jgi:hypothetical protein